MTNPSPKHAAIVLAAGSSQRLGATKQLLCIDGEPLIRRAVRTALAIDPAELLVVVGKNADAVFATIDDLAAGRVDCIDWHTGMSASLRAGIKHVTADCDGALILLCDQPALTVHHLQIMLNAWQQTPERAVASAYANTLGVPAIVPRSWFADIETLMGDHGARDLLRERISSVVAINAPELEQDIDTLHDLQSISL